MTNFHVHVWGWECDRELCCICGDERDREDTVRDLLARVAYLAAQLAAAKARADEAIRLGLQAIATEMAACQMPSLKSGSHDDQGNCDKCEDATRSHCFERMFFDLLADLRRR
jgi:hypothetical protein